MGWRAAYPPQPCTLALDAGGCFTRKPHQIFGTTCPSKRRPFTLSLQYLSDNRPNSNPVWTSHGYQVNSVSGVRHALFEQHAAADAPRVPPDSMGVADLALVGSHELTE